MGLYDSFKLGQDAVTGSTQRMIKSAVQRQGDAVTQANADRQFGLNERQIAVQEGQLANQENQQAIARQNAEAKELELQTEATKMKWNLVLNIAKKNPDAAAQFYKVSGMEEEYGTATWEADLVTAQDGTLYRNLGGEDGLELLHEPYRRENEKIQIARFLAPHDLAAQQQHVQTAIAFENTPDGAKYSWHTGTEAGTGNKTITHVNDITGEEGQTLVIGNDKPLVQYFTSELLKQKTSLDNSLRQIWDALSGGKTDLMAQAIASISRRPIIATATDETMKKELRAMAATKSKELTKVEADLEKWRDVLEQPGEKPKPQSATAKGQQETVAPAGANAARYAASKKKLDALRAASKAPE